MSAFSLISTSDSSYPIYLKIFLLTSFLFIDFWRSKSLMTDSTLIWATSFMKSSLSAATLPSHSSLIQSLSFWSLTLCCLSNYNFSSLVSYFFKDVRMAFSSVLWSLNDLKSTKILGCFFSIISSIRSIFSLSRYIWVSYTPLISLNSWLTKASFF